MSLLPWLANAGNPAMSPYAEGKKGTCHTDIIYARETRKGRVGTTQKLRLKAERWYNECSRDPPQWGQHKATECTGLPLLAQSKHWCSCTNKHSKTKGNADPWQVHWCKWEHWHRLMHRHVSIAILWTLKRTQMLFDVNSIKLHLTAF